MHIAQTQTTRSLHTTSWIEGWSLTIWIALAIACSTFAIIISGQAGAAALGLAIRFTARSSFVLFAAAFSASALVSLAPNRFTHWQRRNRRQLGVAFAASHFTHAVAIGLFAALQPLAFHEHTRTMNPLPGVLAYVFIAAMTATSFDRPRTWIGLRGFRVLHTVGSIYVWIAFFQAFLGRALHVAPGYWFPVGLLSALVILRLWAGIARRA